MSTAGPPASPQQLCWRSKEECPWDQEERLFLHHDLVVTSQHLLLTEACLVPAGHGEIRTKQSSDKWVEAEKQHD